MWHFVNKIKISMSCIKINYYSVYEYFVSVIIVLKMDNFSYEEN